MGVHLAAGSGALTFPALGRPSPFDSKLEFIALVSISILGIACAGEGDCVQECVRSDAPGAYVSTAYYCFFCRSRECVVSIECMNMNAANAQLAKDSPDKLIAHLPPSLSGK